MTYAESGVDVGAGDRFIDLIKPLSKATLRPGCDAELGIINLPPKQTYENENENENRFRNRGKTTSVDTRKRETQTVKLNLVVFGFDTFPRKKPLV